MAQSLVLPIISKTRGNAKEAWIPSNQNGGLDHDEGRSRKRPKKKKKKESSAEIIAGLANLLDQNTGKKTKKKATIMEFRRDPLTGRRV